VSAAAGPEADKASAAADRVMAMAVFTVFLPRMNRLLQPAVAAAILPPRRRSCVAGGCPLSKSRSANL
jgi:hypothetical protein